MKSELLFISTIVASLFLPTITSAQALYLGMASDYALFTTVGAISSTGLTTITGAAGTNVGAFTGFPPGTMTGQLHVADPTSAQVASDLNDANNFLNGISCGASLLPALGNNQTLTPNVYCISGGCTLAGDLILDGLGDSNALFIFKINGAFTSNPSSNIILTGSTTICNVYWQVNGAFDLASNSVFRGTIIANGAVNLYESSTVLGRALTRQGAISLTNIVAAIGTNCPNTLISLPIELLSFNARCHNQNVVLKWTTASETNNDYYSIASGTDAINWQTIGRVNCNGNSTSQRNYSFTDDDPCNETSYYQLKQTDIDGKVQYFNIIGIKKCTQDINELNVYPNPSTGMFNLNYKGDKDQVHSISAYNIIGKKIYTAENYQSGIDLSGQPRGLYFLHFNLSSKIIIKKLMIEK